MITLPFPFVPRSILTSHIVPNWPLRVRVRTEGIIHRSVPVINRVAHPSAKPNYPTRQIHSYVHSKQLLSANQEFPAAADAVHFKIFIKSLPQAPPFHIC